MASAAGRPATGAGQVQRRQHRRPVGAGRAGRCRPEPGRARLARSEKPAEPAFAGLACAGENDRAGRRHGHRACRQPAGAGRLVVASRCRARPSLKLFTCARQVSVHRPDCVVPAACMKQPGAVLPEECAQRRCREVAVVRIEAVDRKWLLKDITFWSRNGIHVPACTPTSARWQRTVVLSVRVRRRPQLGLLLGCMMANPPAAVEGSAPAGQEHCRPRARAASIEKWRATLSRPLWRCGSTALVVAQPQHGIWRSRRVSSATNASCPSIRCMPSTAGEADHRQAMRHCLVDLAFTPAP